MLARTGAVVLLASTLLAGAVPAFAQDEFLLNDDRVDRVQWSPRAARGSTGSLVLAWMDGRNQSGQNVDFDIYAITLRDPRALGSRINRRLNDDPPGAAQGFPDIAASPSGTLFCVWEDGRAGHRDIYGATLDTIGLRITPNFRLNDDATLTDQISPAITAIGPDRYLVVWGDQREGQGEIFGCYLTASGAPIGPNFKISSDPVVAGSLQTAPAVGALANGSALVAWSDGREGGGQVGATSDIYGQLLGPTGQLVGGNFKINGTTGTQHDASVGVAADPTVGFVVAWVDSRGAPADPSDIYAQRYGPSGTPVGGNFRVNDDPPGRAQRNTRAFAIPGAAVVIWEDLRTGLGIDPNVEMSRVGYDSSPAGANVLVNAGTPARQGTPGGVWDGIGAVLAAWEDGRNGTTPDIYAVLILPDGTRQGTETQLNDDAAFGDQRRPRLGRGTGGHVATWIDLRSGTPELYGQWVTTAGGRDGANHRIFGYDGVNRAVSAVGAVSAAGPALVVAQVTRDSDAGEIRGFLYAAQGVPPSSTFWVSDLLPSAQAAPAIAVNGSVFAAAWLDARDGTTRVYGQRIGFDGARIGTNRPVLGVDPPDPVNAVDLDRDPRGGYWLAYTAARASLDQRLWIAHLGEDLVADRSPIEIAPGMPGQRGSPSLGIGPDGRVEVAWLGDGPDGLGAVEHQAFDSTGTALGPILTVRPPGTLAMSALGISVAGNRSAVVWEAKEDGNWSIWLQAFDATSAPTTGVVRVDEDVLGADQLDPSPGMDSSGQLVVVWSDGRSSSSGTDILGRAFTLETTAVKEPDDPPPAPEGAPPARLHLGPARPNPFSGSLAIALETPRPETNTVVRVIDLHGRLVATLHEGPLGVGRFVVRWDGHDRSSRKASSGVYWIVAESGGERRVLRVVQIR